MNHTDSYINTNPEAVAVMTQGNPTEPVVMLNLLRYRVEALPGHGVDGLSGEEAYRAYGRAFAKLNHKFGGEPVWMGRALNTLIGAEDWDLAILVRYPARQDFINMWTDPDYLAISPMRTAALDDSRLVEMTQLLPKIK